MEIQQKIAESLVMAFSMFWDVLWPLILGFTLSAIVQAVVSHKALAKTLGGNSVKNITFASLFGIASSSCSYAAIALSRSLFQKGASFTSAMVFEIASTNLVIELGLILFVLMGWEFALAEWLGGIIMVIFIALIFRFTLTKKLVSLAKENASKDLQGKMEGHAAMDMSITGEKFFWAKLLSKDGITAVSHFFVMEWASLWIDIVIGFVVAGVLTVFVPQSFWQAFFFTDNPTASFILGPLLGPLIAILSFVCSVGNVPLAVVLWNGGISFGGVVSFIFADLIVLPILDIYRKYYGWKVTTYIFFTFYVTMALAGYVIEILFQVFHLIPVHRSILVFEQGISLNYTSYLNIIFIVIAFILGWRFLKSGGPEMLKMMNQKDHMHH